MTGPTVPESARARDTRGIETLVLPDWARAQRQADAEAVYILRLLDELIAERDVHVEAHRRRIEITARHLGVEVGAGRVLVDDADARIERLVDARFDDIDVRIIPRREAADTARGAFTEGLAAGQRRLRREVAA